MKKVIVVGGVPSPIGGVTSYVHRLSQFYKKGIDEVWDLYPHPQKKQIKEPKLILFNGFFDFSFICALLLNRRSIIHFNFSQVRFLFLFSFLFKIKSNKWILTLHNGELSLPSVCRFKIIKFLFNYSMSKFNKIMVLSEKQKKFYVSINIGRNRLFFIDSYVPIDYSLLSVRPTFPDKFNEFKSRHLNDKIILMNGYAKPIYNYEFGIEFVNENDGYCLVVFLYGCADLSYLNLLKSLVIKHDNVVFIEGVEQAVFLNVINSVDIYLRANHVDSFGIAVADAVCLNKIVVASDVCARFEGAHVFSASDYNGMSEMIISLSNESKNKHKKVNFDNYNRSLIKKYELLYAP